MVIATKRRVKLEQMAALIAALGTTGLAGLLLNSCSSTPAEVMVPLEIPGAHYVGNKACLDCHKEIVREFPASPHARIYFEKAAMAGETGCESCHGPGSKHVESGGARGTIINPNKSPETCYQCHLDVRARFNLPVHHPLPEGRVSCGDCHDPHKGSVIKGGGTQIADLNDVCFQCHTAQRGPFVFEHEAVREGCISCHQPHGSVNQKLLTERNQTLCLKCHFQQQTSGGVILIGDVDHSSFLTRGACWTAGCHEAVHGSQVSSSLRF